MELRQIIVSMAVVGSAIGLGVWLDRRAQRRRALAHLAWREMHDLRSLIVDMFLDDDLSASEWEHWRKVCQFADERHRRLHDPKLAVEHTSEHLVCIILRRFHGISM